ncbi:MAG: BrnT family toxin [Rhodoferax sp.]|uniref:BrnT family toxin n=1 Tax=Rhodoferax sp. TaxID=50421 RepID=UPI002626AA8D|nr:BrnT family toxin [Rhodoferax sp.]MDD2883081.1 BrnT family toxin [Rhodoferax sp.]
MTSRLIWDEDKRMANLAKHGLDFADAGEVLDSLYRLDILAVRGGETRTQSLSYVMGCLRVLTVIHIDREGATRVISYRRASTEEREAYYEWISD